MNSFLHYLNYSYNISGLIPNECALTSIAYFLLFVYWLNYLLQGLPLLGRECKVEARNKGHRKSRSDTCKEEEKGA